MSGTDQPGSGPGRTARLFLGLAVAGEAAAYCRAEQLRLAGPLAAVHGRPVPPENFHLTLCFLGQVPVGPALQAAEALRAPLAAWPAFALCLQAGHWFPAGGRPRVLAAAVAPSPALEALARRVREALRPADAALAFLPHVTLARLPRHARACPSLPGTAATATQHVAAVNLYVSRGTPAGVRYEPLLRLPLAGA